MKSVRLITIAFLFVTAASFAANVTKSERFVQDVPLSVGGTFVIENPFGDIEITGADQADVHAVVTKTMIGVNDDAIDEARERTQLRIAGDESTRILRTLVPVIRSPRWSSNVTYQVRVPRTAHVRVVSSASNSIRITNISGNVYVSNFSGTIVLQNILGAAKAESVNGGIVFDTNGRPGANADLSTLNGDIQVYVAADAAFDWEADTIAGEYRTNLASIRGRFTGNSFRGSVNVPGGPTLSTKAMTGKVFLLKKGSKPAQATQLQAVVAGPEQVVPVNKILRTATIVEQRWIYEVGFGDIFVNEVRATESQVSTGGGEVHLGSITGACSIFSGGGPLSVGDAMGPLVARTKAGDIIVNASRKGSSLTTGGGIIRVAYSAGPTTLVSGGGDIVLRRAAGSVNAETRSGDISINVDPTSRGQRLIAKTNKGNVSVNVSPRFAADVELTILTADPDANSIKTDFPGLNFTQEQVGGKVLVRAVGKINGGGERVQLYAEDGGIQFMSSGGVLSSR